ncbi:hypothetical protein [Chitinophaga sp. MM2321]|uniref:hypothetical protein n=1 Tax=Chitinophaga sp. MM2321 TaxID=3137178 RepID=UPI0032D569E6
MLQNSIDSAEVLSINILKKSRDSFEIIKKIRWEDRTGHTLETVSVTPDGVNWTIEITGDDKSWSRPVLTSVQWLDSTGIDFWTTWSDNQTAEKAELWQDPFLTAPLNNLELKYGGADHLSRKAFVIPVATCFFKNKSYAVSFMESPRDNMLDMDLLTNTDGTITYRHTNHRINAGNKVRFSMHLIAHEPDWRGGLAWFYKNYKEYFTVKEPMADVMAGCASYSSYEGDLDEGKYKKMAYSINWKASLDFPYMSMFLPPTKTDEEKWMKMKQEGVTIGDGLTSIKQLSDYSERFFKKGFYTLSYFNVTEAGSHVQKNMPPRKAVMFDDLWKDANDFVYYQMRDAILVPPDHKFPIVSWDWCTVMDPGEPKFQQHLLDQAKRHIEKIPASSGICIDRLDWLRFYNTFRDDGISFTEGKEVSSMLSSWKGLMKKLGPLMHRSHKVIFCNPLLRRIDLMEEIDGIYDEFGQHWQSLNLCSQLATHRPMIAWTASPADFKPNPDVYFQAHLYMGVFLTAPVQGNDHTIKPDAAIEEYYLDYGQMLLALKGRKWLLQPNVVTITGSKVKANVFEVSGSKVLVPLINGGDNEKVRILLSLPDRYLARNKWRVSVLHPGSTEWELVADVKPAKKVAMDISLQRGCAMVRID